MSGINSVSEALLRHVGIDIKKTRTIAVKFEQQVGDAPILTVECIAVDRDGKPLVIDGELVTEEKRFEWREVTDDG